MPPEALVVAFTSCWTHGLGGTGIGMSSEAGVWTIIGRLSGMNVVLSVEMERLGRERERAFGRSCVRACVSKVWPAGRRSTKGSVGKAEEA